MNAIDKLSLQGTKWLRGAAEANPEIPRAARNRLRNPMRLPRFARNDSSIHVHLFMTFTIGMPDYLFTLSLLFEIQKWQISLNEAFVKQTEIEPSWSLYHKECFDQNWSTRLQPYNDTALGDHLF